MKAALLGKPLGHSYSEIIHRALGCDYSLLEVEEDELAEILSRGEIENFNITIPYKRVVVPLLDELDISAFTAGSVNTVVRRRGRLIGYNTDVSGMEYLIKKSGMSLEGERVLILGTGGTSLTARCVARRAGAAEVYVCGRSSAINYANVYDLDPTYIINATPVGMYPDHEKCPVSPERFKSLKGVIDAVYNPYKTQLVMRAREMGIKAQGGLAMLAAQAVYSAEIFGYAKAGGEEIERILRVLGGFCRGVAFIGMAGAGKSTIAKAVAEKLGMEYRDTDDIACEIAGMSVREMFEKYGEEGFRKIEQEAVSRAFSTRAVVATGGGAVLSESNRRAICRGSAVIWIKRSADKCETCGRPLSSSRAEVQRLFEQRRPIYEKMADIIIENEGDPCDAAAAVLEAL